MVADRINKFPDEVEERMTPYDLAELLAYMKMTEPRQGSDRRAGRSLRNKPRVNRPKGR